tara:strand:- start:1134 stop:2543 length:1410 start_codon:yes stop_codon:yes gene_type:complete
MSKRIKLKNICCIGAGYVGGPTMAVIAKECPNISVNVVDINKDRIDSWNQIESKELPIFEPNLNEIVQKARGKNLFFSTDIKSKIAEADLIFISVNTPTKEKGFGAGQASDMRFVEASARTVSEYATGHTIVVEKSTLPVRTAEVIKTILNESVYRKSNKANFSILSNPEFLSEGNAIKDLLHPDRVLIGGENEDAIEALAMLYKNWVPEEKIIKTNIWSSELSKLAANAFLAQRVSSINSISEICEATGAEISQVSRAIGTDTRIGSKFLKSGPGFGGSCFKKDILNLIYLCRYFNLNQSANYWEQVILFNSWHQKRISKLIVRKLLGNIANKKIAIFGFAFKANTNDTRESPSIYIVKDLLEEGAIINIHDYKVSKEQIDKDLKNLQKNTKFKQSNNWNFNNDLLENVNDADAIIILTEWEEYKHLNWGNIATLMRKPSWIFDTRGILNKTKIKKAGFHIWSLGEPE